MSNDQDSLGGTRGDFSPDAIGEFQVMSSQFDAQYGQASGAIINVLTRSGTNDFHARVSGYYRADSLTASDPFAQTNPITGEKEETPFDQWIFSTFLGGAIVKEKLFYFGSFEQTWRDATAVVAVDPAILASLGLPTETSVPQTLREPRVVAKVDFLPTSSNTLTGRFRLDNPETTNDFVGQDAGGGVVVTSEAGFTLDTHNYDYGLSDSWVISPVLLNEARFQYSDQSNDATQQNCPGCPTIIRPSLLSGKLPNQPQTFTEKRYEFIDSVSFTLGSNGEHAFKAGVDYNHINLDAFVPQYFDGLFQFISDQPYNPDDPLTHPVIYLHGTGNPFIKLSNNVVALFVQDQWQVLRNLTLNLGLRWDYEDQVYTKNDWQNFAPRVHFAWDPSCQGKTSVRGGFGMYYDQILLNAPLIGSLFEPGRFEIQATLDPGYPDPGTGGFPLPPRHRHPGPQQHHAVQERRQPRRPAGAGSRHGGEHRLRLRAGLSPAVPAQRQRPDRRRAAGSERRLRLRHPDGGQVQVPRDAGRVPEALRPESRRPARVHAGLVQGQHRQPPVPDQ